MKKKTILGIVTIAICTVLILCELGASEIRVWGKDDNDYEHILSVRDNDIAPSILMGYTACTVMNKNGEIYTWGFDENGQLGEGKKTNAERRSPQKIWEGCSAICRNNCFSNVTMVIKDNDLYSWGSNIYGLTGTTTSGNSSGVYYPTKVLDNVKDAYVSSYAAGAITTDNKLYMWGTNDQCLIADPTIKGYWPIPTYVMNDVDSFSIGANIAGAVKKDGSLYVWGQDLYGEFGTGVQNNWKPVEIMKNVKSIDFTSGCKAILSDNSLVVWGLYRKDVESTTLNFEKVLDNVKYVQGNYAITLDDELYEIKISGNVDSEVRIVTSSKILDDVSVVVPGVNYAGAIDKEGNLYTWGENNDGGQLGDGTYEKRSTPSVILTHVSDAFFSYNSAGAITSDNKVYTWGANEFGQIGDGSRVSSTLPKLVLDLNGEKNETTNNHKYQALDVSFDWNRANFYCQQLGGYLATITSAEEQEDVKNEVLKGTRNSYWVGGYTSLMATENPWKWVTGEAFDYTNWGSGQPDTEIKSDQLKESSMVIYRQGKGLIQSGEWDDLSNDGTKEDDDFFGLDNIGCVCEWNTNEECTSYSNLQELDSISTLLYEPFYYSVDRKDGFYYHILQGNLPEGMKMDSSGNIFGAAKQTGTFTFVVGEVNSSNAGDTKGPAYKKYTLSITENNDENIT